MKSALQTIDLSNDEEEGIENYSNQGAVARLTIFCMENGESQCGSAAQECEGNGASALLRGAMWMWLRRRCHICLSRGQV
ncbi:hypothetical protein EYF80_037518 [Liparis tanakae]|uniref:Uncharacterized protein n=1 Tax=Liparis tanakae TaxID=230148 RepID=A0A4Z2GGD5_9TELE|nr:hypothetical protein EYF80_037518 [Liparis tanakae]